MWWPAFPVPLAGVSNLANQGLPPNKERVPAQSQPARSCPPQPVITCTLKSLHVSWWHHRSKPERCYFATKFSPRRERSEVGWKIKTQLARGKSRFPSMDSISVKVVTRLAGRSSWLKARLDRTTQELSYHVNFAFSNRQRKKRAPLFFTSLFNRAHQPAAAGGNNSNQA